VVTPDSGVDESDAGEQAAVASAIVEATRSDPLADGGIVASTTEMVGAEGGLLQLNDVLLDIPPGAVTGAVQLTLKEARPAAVEGFRAGSQLYILEPSGTLFSQPVTLRIPFTGDPANAAVLCWDKTNRNVFPITEANFDGEYVTVSNTHASNIIALFELGVKGYELYENIQDLRFPCGQDSGKTLIDGYCYSCPNSVTPVKSAPKPQTCCGSTRATSPHW